MIERNYDLSKGGVKFDQDKPEWSLLPIQSCLTGVIRVLMYGAKKYTRDNWKVGMPWLRVLDAAKRHIFAWEEGEDLDKETQLNHIDHALCELLFLRYYITNGVGKDDRSRTMKINVKELDPQPKSPAKDPLMELILANALANAGINFNKLEDMSHEDIEGDKNYWGV